MIRLGEYLYRKRKLRLRKWSHLLKIGVIGLICLEKCQILMKIDVKVVSISSLNHTEIIGKIKKIYSIKYNDYWVGGEGVGGVVIIIVTAQIIDV